MTAGAYGSGRSTDAAVALLLSVDDDESSLRAIDAAARECLVAASAMVRHGDRRGAAEFFERGAQIFEQLGPCHYRVTGSGCPSFSAPWFMAMATECRKPARAWRRW